MAWEDIVAFIIGPLVLFTMIYMVNTSFREDLPAGETTVPAETITQESSHTPLLGLVFISIILAGLGGLAILVSSRSTAFSGTGRWQFLARLGSLGSGHRQTSHRTHGPNGTNSALYFTTAVKLGAATAAADHTALPNELRAVKRIFNLTPQTFPQADEVYRYQLANPEPLSIILRPFLAAYGRGSAVAETLVYGMTCVALADGQMSASELGLIRMAADALGIKPQHTARILKSAGYAGGAQNAHQRQNYSRTSTFQTQKLTERESHLATLGLGADANSATIRKAWRKLASRYHPDKLVSQNLPAKEIEKAENMMQDINLAYDWLKANR